MIRFLLVASPLAVYKDLPRLARRLKVTTHDGVVFDGSSEVRWVVGRRGGVWLARGAFRSHATFFPLRVSHSRITRVCTRAGYRWLVSSGTRECGFLAVGDRRPDFVFSSPPPPPPPGAVEVCFRAVRVVLGLLDGADDEAVMEVRVNLCCAPCLWCYFPVSGVIRMCQCAQPPPAAVPSLKQAYDAAAGPVSEQVRTSVCWLSACARLRSRMCRVRGGLPTTALETNSPPS